MSDIVSGLTDYVNEQKTQLYTTAVLGNETAAFLTPMPGVKYQEALHLLDVTAIPQSISTCTLNPSGNNTHTNRTMTVKDLNFHKSFCPKELEKKWTQVLLRSGSNYTEQEIPAAIIDEYMRQIAKNTEVLDWQGDTTSGSAYLNVYDGLIKIIEAGSYTSPTGSGSTAFTTSNARTIAQNILEAIPSELFYSGDFTIFCGYDFLRKYLVKSGLDNQFNYTKEDGWQGSVQLENSQIVMKAVYGLDGTDKIFGFRTSNAFLGFDNEADKGVDMWYSKDDRKLYYTVDQKRGVQLAFPTTTEVVRFSAS